MFRADVPDIRPPWPQCRATTAVTPSELATLNALPGPVDPVLRRVGCELAGGHSDTHVAFTVAAHGGDQWWWLHWGTGSRELAELGRCDAETADASHFDDCFLPGGHPGPHSFDLQPAGNPAWAAGRRRHLARVQPFACGVRTAHRGSGRDGAS
jgi:hypothetical protein